MAKKAYPEEYRLTLGEKRDGMNYSARTYFFYSSPTGTEDGLSRCPFVRMVASRGGNEQPNGTRITELTITVSQPICIKMVCMHTGFGLPMNRKFIYIDLDPDAEKISIVGLGGFGEFVGRGRINAEKSELTMKVIRENFTVTVLAAPTAGDGNNEVRSIIY